MEPNYENDDMDFFELSSPPPTPKVRIDRGRWFFGIKQALNLFIDDFGAGDYKHSVNNILTMS